MQINVAKLSTKLAEIWMEENYPNNWVEKEQYLEDVNSFVKIPKEHFACIFFNQVDFFLELIQEFEEI